MTRLHPCAWCILASDRRSPRQRNSTSAVWVSLIAVRSVLKLSLKPRGLVGEADGVGLAVDAAGDRDAHGRRLLNEPRGAPARPRWMAGPAFAALSCRRPPRAAR